MGNIPTLKPHEVSRILVKLEFLKIRQRGSHRQYRHEDGKAFQPLTPPALKPDTWVKMIVTPHENKPESFLNTAKSLKLDGPPDWSEKLDEYLYGGKQPDHK